MVGIRAMCFSPEILRVSPEVMGVSPENIACFPFLVHPVPINPTVSRDLSFSPVNRRLSPAGALPLTNIKATIKFDGRFLFHF